MAFAAVAGAGGALAAGTGLVNLSAVPPHPEGWAKLLHFGMRRSVARHADQAASLEPLDSPAMVMRGAAQYAVVCENCHGAPGFGQSPVALSMRPEPPMIVDATTRLSDKELFFVVANGVRYTGMPAWPVQNRPDEVWAMVAFLKTTPKMTRETYLQLARGTSDAGSTTADVGGPGRTSASPSTSAPHAPVALSPFVPSQRERPYLAGDAQEVGTSPAATAFPRTGYGNVAPGGDATSACTACHGSDGAGRAGGAFPNLTLQSPQYIYDALKAFATGQRQSGVMWPIAADLSDEQMRAFASRFGAAPAVASRGERAAGPDDVRSRGGAIVAAGVGSNDVAGGQAAAGPVAPAVERCSSCHLPSVYLSKVIPRIEGQYAAYLRSQLETFRAGGRGDSGPYDPMVANSHQLSDADITAVSAFYASLPPSPKVN